MINIVVESKTTGKSETISAGPFPVDQRDLFKHFVVLADELNECSFVTRAASVEIGFRWTEEHGFQSTSVRRSDEELSAFLHKLRPFYLKNEPTCFERVSNILSRHFKHPRITAFLRNLKSQNDGSRTREVYEMKAGEMVINSETFLDHYLNSLEYHRDAARRAHVDKAADGMPIDMLRDQVVLLLSEKLSVVNGLRNLLWQFEERSDGRVITLRVE